MKQKTCGPQTVASTEAPADAPAHEPRERAVPQTHRQSTAATAPPIKVVEGRGIAFDHPDQAAGQALLMAALGTADHEFFAGIVEQLGDAAVQEGKIDERTLNFMLSVVKGLRPRDPVETLLAAQMAAVHAATMTSARQFARASTVALHDYAERSITKLARTFAIQTEALRRYRSGGEANVTVQHVSVSDGGQAIVGNVTQAAHDSSRRSKVPREKVQPKKVSRGGAPRAAAPERASGSLPARADAPTTAPSRPQTAPVPNRRAR